VYRNARARRSRAGRARASCAGRARASRAGRARARQGCIRRDISDRFVRRRSRWQVESSTAPASRGSDEPTQQSRSKRIPTVDLLPRLKTVGFPRHRTARLGVSGLQSWSTRPDCWRGQAAVTPIPAWDSELPCVGIHTQRPEGDSLGRGVARIPILSVYVGGEIRLGVVVYTSRLYIKLPASTVPWFGPSLSASSAPLKWVGFRLVPL
jgi:hypothetical protein